MAVVVAVLLRSQRAETPTVYSPALARVEAPVN
jgi:hypothetical protein